jgi:ribosomal protein S18 acetylase RimI-like enzyme
MAEIPLYGWDGEAGDGAYRRRTLAAAKRQLRALIRRDVNHPSVAFWSVSNETDESRPVVVAGNRALVRLAQALDPTRLAVHVSDRWRDHPHFEADDVICVNGYPSWAAHTGEDDVAPTAYWREGLAALHARYPETPILVTEFGHPSLLGVRGGAFGEDVHAQALAQEFAGMDAPYVCGATVWCWADHPWPASTFAFARYLAESPFGVLTRGRLRKRAHATARRLFRRRQGLEEPAPRTEAGRWGAAGYQVFMIRPHLDDIPQVPLPEGFTIRPMRVDEGALWRDIWRDAEPYNEIGEEVFYEQFGHDLRAMQWRTFVVFNAKGVGVGVISAWYDRAFKGQDYGQIHWVAVREAYWGRGLGKAMLSHALNALARWHTRAYLGTQSERLPAIKLYLDFGFLPDLDRPGAREAWRAVAARLDHPALAALDLGDAVEADR